MPYIPTLIKITPKFIIYYFYLYYNKFIIPSFSYYLGFIFTFAAYEKIASQRCDGMFLHAA
jgi:hypothetical protein